MQRVIGGSQWGVVSSTWNEKLKKFKPWGVGEKEGCREQFYPLVII